MKDHVPLFRQPRRCLLTAAAGLILFFSAASLVSGIEVSQIPMSQRLNPAPPNAMFVLDNSGSMDWEFMTTEDNGTFAGGGTVYEYLFDNPGDNNFPPGDIYGTILSNDDRGLWKAQWSGYNKIFYNPHSQYLPWPRKSDVDISDLEHVRSNPNNATPTFDLTAQYHSIIGERIMVDNTDAGFSYSDASHWGTTTYPNQQGSNYHFSEDQPDNTVWAKWTPTLPGPGTYEVFVWFRNVGLREHTVTYDVKHAGVITTVSTIGNITGGTPISHHPDEGQGDQWISLGTFRFNGHGEEYVKLNANHTRGSCCRYGADAAMFQPATISITRAHYYTIDDADGDGEQDPGEAVYLVNFVQEGGNWVRKYYRFDDTDGDDRVEAGELTEVTGSDIPDAVKPAVYKEDGIFVRYKTDTEDLQNFANWYSFYRRRELAAKAAVATSITRISRVNVGFYTINPDYGARTGVLPVKVETNAIIVDDKDSNFTRSSIWYWQESDSPNAWENSALYTTEQGEWAKWTPTIPSTGTYKVYTWYNCFNNRDTKAKYTIHHDGGDSVVEVNQRQESGNPCGEWVYLGEYTFNEGTEGYVKVERTGSSTGSSTLADAVKFEPTSGLVESDETDTLLDMLYAIDSNGGTPLRDALHEVGEYYDQTDGDHPDLGASPYESEENGGLCQMAFAIAMTDGYWNGYSPGVGNADGTGGCPGGEICSGVAPWSDSYSDTLADVAMKFYKKDLSTSLPDEVPEDQCDKANWQHMVTYTVSFGVTGNIDPEEHGSCPDPGTAIDWPDPGDADDPDKIDDLYHAAVNGRGVFFSAQDPEELVDALVSILQSIQAKSASGASVTANGENLTGTTRVYQARFDTSDWSGDLMAFAIDPETGTVCTDALLSGQMPEFCAKVSRPMWSAQEKLHDLISQSGGAGLRTVVTYNPGTGDGIPFRYPTTSGYGSDGLTRDQLLALDPSWSESNATRAQNLVAYLRGEAVTGFRNRTKALADLIHSAPLLYLHEDKDKTYGTLFVGSNGGMLHAFNMDDGTERFAYVPNLVFDNLKYLAENDYSHLFFVDNSPALRVIPYSSKTNMINRVLLVCGLGAGGKGYFALDVKDAHTITSGASSESTVRKWVMWEYPNSATPSTDADDLGLSFSRAFIVKKNKIDNLDPNESEQWVVIFGNGYNSTNGHAVLFVLDALTGKLLRKIDTGEGGNNGLSTPTLIDPNNDGRVDYVYAGDLKGNLWKFDLTSGDAANWSVAFNDGTNPVPLFRAGTSQPITTKPEVMYHCKKHGYIVVFGTGKFIGAPDRETENYPVQSIYGIWDFADDAEDSGFIGPIANRTTGKLSYPSGFFLAKQEEIYFGTHFGHALRVLSDNPANYYTKTDPEAGQAPDPALHPEYANDGVDNNGDGNIDEGDEGLTHLGWFFDFPNTEADFKGERVIVDPLIREGRAIVISFSPRDSACSGSGWSLVHEMDACSGGRLSEAVFDINGDHKITEEDMITITINGVRVKVPPTGIAYLGLLQPPKILRLKTPGQPPREVKLFNNETATMTPLFEKAEKRGIYYWLEK